MYSEQDLSTAISAYRNKEFTSIRQCATAFSIPESTLRSRLSGGTSRSIAHESEQYLSKAEEQTLIRYIFRLSRSGCPIPPSLARDLAVEIRTSRYSLATSLPTRVPLSKRWINRLYKRYPELKATWSRQLEANRHRGTRYSIVDAYFTAISTLFVENNYAPEDIYNVDESGFAIGTSSTSRVLINRRDKEVFKRIPGRQEWITAIECISALGVVLPPLLIFKAKYTNTGWIPTSTPSNYRFSTSTNGWTSDLHAYE